MLRRAGAVPAASAGRPSGRGQVQVSDRHNGGGNSKPFGVIKDRDGNLRRSRLHRICPGCYKRAGRAVAMLILTGPGVRRRVASVRPTTFGPAVYSITSSASGPPPSPHNGCAKAMGLDVPLNVL
jgi:hypothetical protein